MARYMIVHVRDPEECPQLGDAIRPDRWSPWGPEHETLPEAEAVVLANIGRDELLIICDMQMRVRIR